MVGAPHPQSDETDPDAQLDNPSWELRERLQLIRKVRWIDYPAATAAIDRLGWLFDGPPTHRPPCCLLYSDTNNGKTTICLKFARDVNGAVEVDAGERAEVPVL